MNLFKKRKKMNLPLNKKDIWKTKLKASVQRKWKKFLNFQIFIYSIDMYEWINEETQVNLVSFFPYHGFFLTLRIDIDPSPKWNLSLPKNNNTCMYMYI